MKSWRWACCWIVLPLALGDAQGAETDVFVPFTVNWRAEGQSPASAAFLLSAPAGKDGFITVKDGRLVRPDGRRFRIWGLNVTMRAGLPPKEQAPRLAARLADYGINCLRFHFLDRLAPTGLIDAWRDDTRALDAAQLDRLDFFVAELKKRGIYTNLNLNVGRIYKPGDNVRDHELLGYAKGLTYFDPQLLMLQREYARQLLTHRNAYTGNEYRHEPAVAIVELVNENSIVESWFSGRLLGQQTRRNPGTWADIPASYEKELTQRYNEYLRQRFGPDVLSRLRREAKVGEGELIPRLKPAEFAAASKERFHAEATFYMDMERRYFAEMGRFLKQELGVRALVVGTSDHNHGRTGYPLLSSTAQLDVVDGHVYWQHPSYVTDAAGKRIGFTIPNTPMVNNPWYSTPVQLSRSAVAGRPYTVSEVNHPFPNEYACEGVPILAAWAALHDWDGVFWYTLAHNDVVEGEPRIGGHFDFAFDPVKMAQLAAGALVFLRGDVAPAQRTLQRAYTAEQVIESLRMTWKDRPYFTPGFDPGWPLVHATRVTSFDAPQATMDRAEAVGEPIRSDTGELVWSAGREKRDGADTRLPGGVATIQTARSEAMVGFLRDRPQTLRHLSATLETPFCALTLSSLDELPIARANRLLLTATARVGNSGMKWNDKRTTLESWGTAPTVIEPVRGMLTLRGLEQAAGVTAQPLDGGGQPLGEPQRLQRTADGWQLVMGRPATTWYVLAVSR